MFLDGPSFTKTKILGHSAEYCTAPFGWQDGRQEEAQILGRKMERRTLGKVAADCGGYNRILDLEISRGAFSPSVFRPDPLLLWPELWVSEVRPGFKVLLTVGLVHFSE